MDRIKFALAEMKDYAAVRQMLNDMNVVDIADELMELNGDMAVTVFRMLKKDKAAEVFSYLDHTAQQNIVSAITDSEIGTIMDELFLDDVVDFIEEMPASVVTRVLENVPESKRKLINQFLKYPEDSAGSIMTIEYVELKPQMTVKQALAHIRRTGVDKETIYTCYVVGAYRRLKGIVTVRQLLLSNDDALIGDIMDKNIISATTTEDRETLVNDFGKYDLLAMPVVDGENRLVGIVTIDDAFEAQEEEATEDFEIMAAISPSEEPYLKTSVFTLTKNRILWLLLLMLSATVTGGIITSFENALAVMPALVASIPMLMDTGGNAGSQSSTLIIRGMAVDEISLNDSLTVLWKEVRVAVLCGGVLAAVNLARIMIMGGGAVMALTVSLALYATVILAKSVGCMLPMLAKRLKLDPAVMASPVITTIVDAGSLLLYFALAKVILGI